MNGGVSRERVGEDIQHLEGLYGSFPVNQTTLSLSAAAYEAARERAREGAADVYVRVRNDDGDVLHVEGDDGPRVPRCVGDGDTGLAERARREVREATGVCCSIDGIARVTIAGVRNAADPDADPVYRLLVLFEAVHEGGVATDGVWQADPETPEFV